MSVSSLFKLFRKYFLHAFLMTGGLKKEGQNPDSHADNAKKIQLARILLIATFRSDSLNKHMLCPESFTRSPHRVPFIVSCMQ